MLVWWAQAQAVAAVQAAQPPAAATPAAATSPPPTLQRAASTQLRVVDAVAAVAVAADRPASSLAAVAPAEAAAAARAAAVASCGAAAVVVVAVCVWGGVGCEHTGGARCLSTHPEKGEPTLRALRSGGGRRRKTFLSHTHDSPSWPRPHHDAPLHPPPPPRPPRRRGRRWPDRADAASRVEVVACSGRRWLRLSASGV